MSPYIAKFIGTMLLVLLGDGVVANVVLKDTKGEKSGWIAITFGWGMAVFVAVFCVAEISGAHINPAVTLGLACAGEFGLNKIPGYLASQFAGGAVGAGLVWLVYRDHFKLTEDANAKLAVFCTGPEIRNYVSNLISEIIGTFVLVYAVLHITSPKGGLGALDALPVGLLVFAIGLSLGGTTGYAINPAVTSAPESCTACCQSPTNEIAIGAMSGSPSSARSAAEAWQDSALSRLDEPCRDWAEVAQDCAAVQLSPRNLGSYC